MHSRLPRFLVVVLSLWYNADIVLRFYGYGRVSWDERQTTYIKGSAPTVSCKNTETYLDHSVSLLRKGMPTSLFHSSLCKNRNLYTTHWTRVGLNQLPLPKKHFDLYSHFDTVYQFVGQTDRQTGIDRENWRSIIPRWHAVRRAVKVVEIVGGDLCLLCACTRLLS